jgi:DNA primase
MTASEATIVDAGGRDLRVTSADRVIFPETERSGAVTKLDIVKYYLAVEDGIMRALVRRPTTLERWPKGVHPGIVVSTREKGGGDAFYQKRIPRGAPDFIQTARIEFPSGRHADEICPTEVAVVGWAAQMGTITFHPWPVRDDDVDHPDELRIDLDPQPGTDFADAVSVAAEHVRCWTSSATRDSRRRPAAAGCTSTSGSNRAGRSPTSATPRSRSGASSSGVSRIR